MFKDRFKYNLHKNGFLSFVCVFNNSCFESIRHVQQPVRSECVCELFHCLRIKPHHDKLKHKDVLDLQLQDYVLHVIVALTDV